MASNAQPNKNKNSDDNKKGDSRKVEGEGSYTATRRYNANLADDLKKGKTERGAEEARRAIEGPQREELKRAEEEAKRGPKHNQ